MMTMGIKNESSLLYKAVDYQTEALGYMEMIISKSYGGISEQECMSNYHFNNGRYLGLVEAIASDLKVPIKRVEYLVKVLKRKR